MKNKHEHKWLCSNTPGIYKCSCKKFAIWNRQEQKIEEIGKRK